LLQQQAHAKIQQQQQHLMQLHQIQKQQPGGHVADAAMVKPMAKIAFPHLQMNGSNGMRKIS
jgi:hypothetical protein